MAIFVCIYPSVLPNMKMSVYAFFFYIGVLTLFDD